MEEKDFILEVDFHDVPKGGGKSKDEYRGRIVVCGEDQTYDYYHTLDGSQYYSIPKELTEQIQLLIDHIDQLERVEEKPFTSPYIETTYTDDPGELRQPELYLAKIIALKTAGFTAEEIMAMAEKGLV